MTTTLRLLLLALLASSTLGLTECKKSSGPDPKKTSERETWLTTSGWRLERYVVVETTAAGVVTTTDYPLTAFDACSLDDLQYYRSDKSYAVNEGPTKCSDAYPSYLISGTWNFASNETAIIINPSQPDATRYQIQTLTATTFSNTATTTDSNGATSVQTRTFSAQ